MCFHIKTILQLFIIKLLNLPYLPPDRQIKLLLQKDVLHLSHGIVQPTLYPFTNLSLFPPDPIPLGEDIIQAEKISKDKMYQVQETLFFMLCKGRRMPNC